MPSDRPLWARTPLGPDAVLPIEFSGREAISEPFEFRLLLAAPLAGPPVAFDNLLGRPVTVGLDAATGPARYWNGIVRRVETAGRDPDFAYYRAFLVPKLWLLSLNTRCRVFQQVSVPDILRQLFEPLRPNVTARLSEQHDARDYCVQYNETDLAFAHRLMEQEGIAYYFQHTEDEHTLVLTDRAGGFGELPLGGDAAFADAASGPVGRAGVSAWDVAQELRPATYASRDYLFELPTLPLAAASGLPPEQKAGGLDLKPVPDAAAGTAENLYPAAVADRYDGIDPNGAVRSADLGRVTDAEARDARLRAQASANRAVTVTGAGPTALFTPGYTVCVSGHPSLDGPFLLTAVEHEARNPSPARSEMSPGEFSYGNRCGAVPAGQPYRPARVTPRPTIPGPQTAVVVGPSGQEIFVDPYGRVKVRFHWDARESATADVCCWVRVAQVWAGAGWGAFFWPRVGHEVVVLFEDGDPDRPIVVGSVYNAANMPPRLLPARAMEAGVVSKVFGADAADRGSAVIFYDVPGLEYVRVHSETHDFHSTEATQTHVVPGARIEIIGISGS